MPRPFFFALLVIAPIAASVARDATATLAAGRPLALPSGQSIELIEVSDSRCAPGQKCAGGGYARLLLHWRSSATAPPTRLTLATTTADGQARDACLFGTLVRIRNVAPLPTAGATIPIADYRVTVTIGTCPNERPAS